MTPALKAMVEAMAAELERQAKEGGVYVPPDGVMFDDGITAAVDGCIDLEKVARAGLEALDRLDGDTVWQGYDGLNAETAAKVTHRRLVGAILKDSPTQTVG